jgi:hypothetical protein
LKKGNVEVDEDDDDKLACSHRSMFSANQATKDYCSELSLSRPTKALKRKGETGWFSLYASYVIGGRTDLEGQPGHISARVEKRTFHLGIHALYMVYKIFSNEYNIDIIFL